MFEPWDEDDEEYAERCEAIGDDVDDDFWDNEHWEEDMDD